MHTTMSWTVPLEERNCGKDGETRAESKLESRRATEPDPGGGAPPSVAAPGRTGTRAPSYSREADRSVHDLLRQAMELFEEAERLRAPGDHEAILRWNACARLLQQRPEIEGPDRAIPQEMLK